MGRELDLNEELKEDYEIIQGNQINIHSLKDKGKISFDEIQLGDYILFENGVGRVMKKGSEMKKIIVHSFVKNPGIVRGTMKDSAFFYNSIGYINEISKNPDKIIWSYGWDEINIPDGFAIIKDKLNNLENIK